MAEQLDTFKPATVFRTTQWSMVLSAGDVRSPDAGAALARLCESYWYPLYCCVRRHGHSPEDSQDLTQAFFAKLLQNEQIALADPERGRFRTFLLRSLENFLHNEHQRATAQKRGGGQTIVSWDAQAAEARHAAEPLEKLSPAELFDRRWAVTLLTETLARLRGEFSTSGRVSLFDYLEPHLWGDDDSTPYAQIAAGCQMTLVAVKVTMHRLRQRYGSLLREEIAQTLDAPEALEDELEYLRRALAG